MALAVCPDLPLLLLGHRRPPHAPLPRSGAGWITWLEIVDGIFQVGAPGWYISDVTLVLGCVLLFGRRLINRQVRYLPGERLLPAGADLCYRRQRHPHALFLRTDIDIVNIKQLTVGLVTFSPTIGAEIGSIFYIHLFLVCVLLAYFPFSKLMHIGGVFLSPTRNLKNNSRAVRHVNPWNPRILPHSYAGYEDEFREFMVDAGIPVEKELAEKKDE